jgi:hypothetical protein
MPTLRLLVAGISVGVVLSAAASIADTPSTNAPSPAAVAQEEPAPAPPDTAPATRAPSPLMLEVRAALEREREQVEALRARLKEKPGDREALALQREIESVKLDTEVTILRIQAGAARRAGHAALAERLEIAARDLLTPPAATTTAARPAPRAAGR